MMHHRSLYARHFLIIGFTNCNGSRQPSNAGQPGVIFGLGGSKMATTSNRPTGWRSYGRTGQTALLIAALLSLLWQAVLVQTHVHPRAERVSIMASSAYVHGDVRKNQPAPDPPDTCPICHELAHAGAFITPDAVGFFTSQPTDNWLGNMPSLGFAWASKSHAWQSRAPPLLQA